MQYSSKLSSSDGRRKGKKSNIAKGDLSADESLENIFSRTKNKGNDKNGASNKDEFHKNHSRHITNATSDERSA